jgi:hypothetical protein
VFRHRIGREGSEPERSMYLVWRKITLWRLRRMILALDRAARRPV